MTMTIRSAWQKWSKPRCCLPPPSAGSQLHHCWGHCKPKLHRVVLTAGVEARSIVLHDEPGDAILEWFVEFAESPDNKIDKVVDIGIRFLFVIDGLDILIGMLLANTEEIVNRIIHDLHDLLGDELFLDMGESTSPSSMGLSYKNITQF